MEIKAKIYDKKSGKIRLDKPVMNDIKAMESQIGIEVKKKGKGWSKSKSRTKVENVVAVIIRGIL